MNKKKIYRMVIFFVIILSTVFNPVFAAENDRGIDTGTFMYLPTSEDTPLEEKYYYDDEYFSKSSKEKNDHLITMSMALALSTFEDGDCTYVTSLLEKIGFKDIETEDMTSVPSKDTIGTTISHKKINDEDVIAVAIRGKEYKAEWASNAIVGESGNAVGFEDAADKVLKRLADYKGKHKLSKIKIWITGYSRAGAVSNLVGVHINEHLDQFNIAEDDLYVFTFEAPGSCSNGKAYNNIYTIINRNDVVPYVYSEKWGLHNNGVPVYIGDSLYIDTKKINIYGFVGIGKILSNDSKREESQFLKEYVDWLTEYITREKYTQIIDYKNNLSAQKALSNLLELYYSKNSIEQREMINFFKDAFINEITDSKDFVNILVSDLYDLCENETDEMYQKVVDDLLIHLDRAKNKSSFPLNEDDYIIVRNSVYPLLRVVGPAAISEFSSILNDSETIEDTTATSNEFGDIYYMPTFLGNINDIIQNHFPENNFRLVTEIDSYYRSEELDENEENKNENKESCIKAGITICIVVLFIICIIHKHKKIL